MFKGLYWGLDYGYTGPDSHLPLVWLYTDTAPPGWEGRLPYSDLSAEDRQILECYFESDSPETSESAAPVSATGSAEDMDITPDNMQEDAANLAQEVLGLGAQAGAGEPAGPVDQNVPVASNLAAGALVVAAAAQAAGPSTSSAVLSPLEQIHLGRLGRLGRFIWAG